MTAKSKQVTVKGVVFTPFARSGETRTVSPSRVLARYIELGYVEVIHEDAQQGDDPDQPSLNYDDTGEQDGDESDEGGNPS